MPARTAKVCKFSPQGVTVHAARPSKTSVWIEASVSDSNYTFNLPRRQILKAVELDALKVALPCPKLSFFLYSMS